MTDEKCAITPAILTELCVGLGFSRQDLLPPQKCSKSLATGNSFFIHFRGRYIATMYRLTHISGDILASVDGIFSGFKKLNLS